MGNILNGRPQRSKSIAETDTETADHQDEPETDTETADQQDEPEVN